MKRLLFFWLCLVLVLRPLSVAASEDKNDGANDEDFDFVGMILHHVSDTHEFHILEWNGHPVYIPLPVILWTERGLVFFASSRFKHDDDGAEVVHEKDLDFVRFHNKIYQLNEGAKVLTKDDSGHPIAKTPLDFSVTKHVFSLVLSAGFIFFLLRAMAIGYSGGPRKAPKGVAKFLEPLVLFIKNDVIIPNIGTKKSDKFIPYLLSLFFFICINNLVGLIPFFPFSANLSGNIAFTFSLALLTLILILVNGNKNFWGHIFTPKGVPWWVLPILAPIELVGIFTKPFALMIRLFANITAGHIIILSIVSIIFIYESYFAGVGSAIFLLFLYSIELLVAFVQAYIFTMLTALFIGQAVEDAH